MEEVFATETKKQYQYHWICPHCRRENIDTAYPTSRNKVYTNCDECQKETLVELNENNL